MKPKLKCLRLYALLTVVMLLSLCVSIPVHATDSPLAELYFYNHSAIGGLSALNTTSYASQAESSIDNAGYNCYSYTNVQAGPASSSSVVRTLDDDAVFFINAHGGNGRVVCVDNNSNVTRVSAKKVTSDSSVYSLEYNFENTTDQLKTLKIAYWMGCNTYGTSSTYGSLNSKCTSLGVDCSITHNDNIWAPYCSYFQYRFAYYSDQGNNVSTALVNAKSSCYSYFSTSPGSISELDRTVNSYVTSGPTGYSSVSMEPAGYGSY